MRKRWREDSKFTFDVPAKISVGDVDVASLSAKGRTLSMEMHEAIEALHGEDEGT